MEELLSSQKKKGNMAVCSSEFKMRTQNRTDVVTGIQQERMCEYRYI